DSGAGIAACPPDQVLSSDGAQQMASGTAIDRAGRSTSATSDPINIDQAAPAILVTLSPSPNENGWYSAAPVTAHFVGVDPLSGVLSCPPDQFATTDGIQTFTGTVTDKAGNTTSATSDPVKIDLGAPTIT